MLSFSLLMHKIRLFYLVLLLLVPTVTSLEIFKDSQLIIIEAFTFPV